GFHVERVDQEFEHRMLFACLEVEIDHFLHHERAYNHPDCGSRQHYVTNGIPTACVSKMRRNSVLIGSGASDTIILIQSSSGKPALMPRTITSTASGKCSRNFVSRRFLRKDNSHRGTPKAPAKPRTAETSRPAPPNVPKANIASPIPAEIIQNWRFDQDRPARAILAEIGTFLDFLWRS